MKNFKLILMVLVVSALVLTACGAGSSPDNVMTNNNVTTMNDKDNMAENMSEAENADMDDDNHGDMNDDSMNESMNDKDEDMMDSEDGEEMSGEMDDSVTTPAWFDYELVEVTSGETFTINSLRGQVVLVEMMATWCSNCMKQQQQVKELHNLLADRDDFVGVGISLELELEPNRLANYVQENGFNWTYGISTKEVQEGIINSFGGDFLQAPATPIVIVDKDGGVHPLPLGKIQTADELLAFVEPYLN